MSAEVLRLNALVEKLQHQIDFERENASGREASLKDQIDVQQKILNARSVELVQTKVTLDKAVDEVHKIAVALEAMRTIQMESDKKEKELKSMNKALIWQIETQRDSTSAKEIELERARTALKLKQEETSRLKRDLSDCKKALSSVTEYRSQAQQREEDFTLMTARVENVQNEMLDALAEIENLREDREVYSLSLQEAHQTIRVLQSELDQLQINRALACDTNSHTNIDDSGVGVDSVGHLENARRSRFVAELRRVLESYEEKSSGKQGSAAPFSSISRSASLSLPTSSAASDGLLSVAGSEGHVDTHLKSSGKDTVSEVKETESVGGRRDEGVADEEKLIRRLAAVIDAYGSEQEGDFDGSDGAALTAAKVSADLGFLDYDNSAGENDNNASRQGERGRGHSPVIGQAPDQIDSQFDAVLGRVVGALLGTDKKKLIHNLNDAEKDIIAARTLRYSPPHAVASDNKKNNIPHYAHPDLSPTARLASSSAPTASSFSPDAKNAFRRATTAAAAAATSSPDQIRGISPISSDRKKEISFGSPSVIMDSPPSSIVNRSRTRIGGEIFRGETENARDSYGTTLFNTSQAHAVGSSNFASVGATVPRSPARRENNALSSSDAHSIADLETQARLLTGRYDLRNAERTIAELRKETDDLADQKAGLAQSLMQSRLDLQEAEKTVISLQLMQHAAEKRLQAAQTELDAAQSLRVEYETELQALQRSQRDLVQASAAKDTVLAQYASERDRLEMELQGAWHARDEAEASAESLNKAHKDMQFVIEALTTKLETSDTELKRLKLADQRQDREVLEVSLLKDQLLERSVIYEKEIEALERQNEALRSESELVQKTGLLSRYELLELELVAMTSKSQALEEQLNSVTAALRTAEVEIQRLLLTAPVVPSQSSAELSVLHDVSIHVTTQHEPKAHQSSREQVQMDQLSVASVAENEAELQTLSASLARVSAEKAALQLQLDSHIAEIARLSDENEKILKASQQEVSAQLETQKFTLLSQVKTLSASVAELSASNSALENAHKNALTELDALQQASAEVHAELLSARERAADIETKCKLATHAQQAAETRNSELQSELTKLHGDLSIITLRRDEAASAYEKLERDLSVSANQIISLEASLRELSNDKTQLASTNQQLLQERDVLERERAGLRQLTRESESQLATLQHRLDELVTAKEADAEAFAAEKETLAQRVASLETDIIFLHEGTAGLKEALADAQTRAKDLEQAAKAHQADIEQIEWLVRENKTLVQDCDSFSAENGTLKAQVTEVTSECEALRDSIDQLMHAKAKHESANETAVHERVQLQQQIESLQRDSDVFKSDMLHLRYSKDALASAYDEVATERDNLKRRVAELEGSQAEHVSLQQRLSELEREVEYLHREKIEAGADREAVLTQVTAECNLLKKREADAASSIEQLQSTLLSVQSAHDALVKARDESDNERERALLQVATLQSDVERQKLRVRELSGSDELTENAALKSLENDLTTARNEVARLKTENEKLASKRATADRTMVVIKAEKENVSRQLKSMEEQVSKLMTRLERPAPASSTSLSSSSSSTGIRGRSTTASSRSSPPQSQPLASTHSPPSTFDLDGSKAMSGLAEVDDGSDLGVKVITLEHEVSVLQSELTLARELANDRVLREGNARQIAENALVSKEKDLHGVLQELISTKVSLANLNHELVLARRQQKNTRSSQSDYGGSELESSFVSTASRFAEEGSGGGGAGKASAAAKKLFNKIRTVNMFGSN